MNFGKFSRSIALTVALSLGYGCASVNKFTQAQVEETSSQSLDQIRDSILKNRLEEKVTERIFDTSKLTDSQLKRLSELYKNAPPDDANQIEDLVYGFFDANQGLRWNVGIGLYAPDSKKVNVGVTKHDNPLFEEIKTSWDLVKQYANPETIVDAAGKIQKRFVDTYNQPSIYNRVRSYLRAKAGTVKEAVIGILGTERTVEGGAFRIDQFFNGRTDDYEVKGADVSLQVHRGY